MGAPLNYDAADGLGGQTPVSKATPLPVSQFPGTPWQYAGVTGGLVDTSDVAIKAAGAAGVVNYLVALQYQNSDADPSEIVVKDGATVIWRGYAPGSMAYPANVVFPLPLKGTAPTPLNVAMLTTATATVVSAQGYSL